MELGELCQALRCDAEWSEGRCYGRVCQGCAYQTAGEEFSTQALERLAAGALERLLAAGPSPGQPPAVPSGDRKERVFEQAKAHQKQGGAGNSHRGLF